MIWLYLLLFTTSTHAIFDAYRAQQLHQAGDVAAAQSLYQDMVVDDVYDWRALYNLGTIALNGQSYDEAVHDFEKVVALQPDNKEAQERLEIARKLRDQQKQQQEDEKKKQEQQEKEDQDKKEQNQDQQEDNSQHNSQDQQNKSQQDKKQSNDQRKQDQEKKQEEQKNGDESDKRQQDEEKQKKLQQEKDAQAREERKKQAEQQRAAQTNEQSNKKFSQREQYVLKELDKLDQKVQKEMVRYAVSQTEQGAEQHGGRKNW